MPGGDRTGPIGMGPMTGRAAGYCSRYPGPGFMNSARGRGFRGGGFGWGRGGGRRHRHWYYATCLPGWERAEMGLPAYQPYYPEPSHPRMTAEEELQALNREAEHFEQVLENLRTRIRAAESSKTGAKTT